MIDEIKASVLLIVHMLKMRLLFSNKHKTSIVSKKACASEFLRFGSFCPYLNQFPSKASQCFENARGISFRMFKIRLKVDQKARNDEIFS